MALEDDVLVIGGGLAGLTAGIAAARAGAGVRVLSAADSTLRQASGLVDVLGYDPDGAGPLPNPFSALGELPAEHPYRVVGETGVREGLALFDDVVGEAYAGGHTDRNALVPTCGGTVKPTARYPATVADGLASDGRDALLVGFEAETDFDAPLAAEHLAAAGVPFDVRGVTVPFPGDFESDAAATRRARALDEDELLAADGGTRPARDALAATVEPCVEGVDRVGFPAILGRRDPAGVVESLEESLGTDVFEVPTGPPSLPGLRLESALHATLREVGGTLASGNPVVDYESDGHRIERVFVDRNGARVPHVADEYILATGGLVGEGIRADREQVAEPVFDCHVPQPDDRYAWFADDAFGDHPFARFGVQVDDELRPLDARDAPEFDNLRAAGSVIGGYDFAAEKSGAGVSLATGKRAGERAAEEAA